MPRRLCLDCGKHVQSRSRCTRCEKKRQRLRVKVAPWVALYDLPEWSTAKWAVHRRDGYRCTYADKAGRRCATTNRTGRIDAHHTTKVRELYAAAKGDWDTFLRLALDRSKIVTLCHRHHQLADRPANPGRPARRSVSADRLSRRAKRARARRKVK